MPEAGEGQFANSLDTVLSKLPYEHPMEGHSVYKSKVEIAEEDAFRDVSGAELVDPQNSSSHNVSVIFTHALRNNAYVLDAARRAIETNHPRLASFTDRDKRFLLHLAADIRLGHLEHLVRAQEARSTFPLKDPSIQRGLVLASAPKKIAQIRAFQEELGQTVTEPAPDVSKV